MTSANKGFTTTILHHDRQKSIEHGSVHKPVHTAVMYGYKDAVNWRMCFRGKPAVIVTAVRAIRLSVRLRKS
jgi:O-acetylhomoserine (thiol)-lyase